MTSTRADGIWKLRHAAATLESAGDDAMRTALRLALDGLADVIESSVAPATRERAIHADGARMLLTADDVAEELGVSRRQAYVIVREAGAQHVGERAVRVSRRDLDTWLRERSKAPPVAPPGRDAAPAIRPVRPRIRPRDGETTSLIPPPKWRGRRPKQRDER